MRAVTHLRRESLPGRDLSLGGVGPARQTFGPQRPSSAANPKESASHASE